MNLAKLEEILGVKFKNPDLLKKALTHRSYLNETKDSNLVSNERLEFLGDAVLSLVVSTFLFQKFSESPEGDLTSFRSSLVKTTTLSQVAQEIHLGEYLLLSRGEEDSGGRSNQSLLADSLEAVIGAIFIDSGLSKASLFIAELLFPLLPEIIRTRSFKDYKSLFQEKIQADKKTSPVYKVLETSGPDHNRIFTIGVFAARKKLGEGRGHSKQIAEQEAAKVALEKSGYLR